MKSYALVIAPSSDPAETAMYRHIWDDSQPLGHRSSYEYRSTRDVQFSPVILREVRIFIKKSLGDHIYDLGFSDAATRYPEHCPMIVILSAKTSNPLKFY